MEASAICCLPPSLVQPLFYFSSFLLQTGRKSPMNSWAPGIHCLLQLGKLVPALSSPPSLSLTLSFVHRKPWGLLFSSSTLPLLSCVSFNCFPGSLLEWMQEVRGLTNRAPNKKGFMQSCWMGFCLNGNPPISQQYHARFLSVWWD